MKEKKVKPTKVFEENNNIWSTYKTHPDQPTLLSLFDKTTGATLFTTHANPQMRAAAFKAWAAARHSRSPDETAEIFEQMGAKGVNPDEKLEETFSTYGHGSVADGSRLEVHFNDTPMHLPFAMFHLGYINSGQEKSTRYQKSFASSLVHPVSEYLTDASPETITYLESRYQEIAKESIDNFSWMKEVAAELYKEHFKPIKSDIPEKNEMGAFNSRVLDTARYCLLMGQNTGFAYETSARDWARKIGYLKGHNLEYYHKIGAQLETILAPEEHIEKEMGVLAEANSLVRHTDANNSLPNLLDDLKKENDLSSIKSEELYSKKQELNLYTDNPGVLAIAQFLSVVNPGTDFEEILRNVNDFSDMHISELSKQIYAPFNNYNEAPSITRTTPLAVELVTQLGEIRDWNRHKSVGRFVTSFPQMYGTKVSSEDFEQSLLNGWGYPAYLDMFPDLKQEYTDRMDKYYEKIFAFSEDVQDEIGNEDVSFMNNLLPLGHQSSMIMHATPQDVNYISKLRARPGGHINYRMQAYDFAQAVANSHPSLSGLALDSKRPDPTEREQFFNRS